tara:strand:- start:8309 stop:8422 length:114 start_codon:yes stop_codon:yes gene_type:complete
MTAEWTAQRRREAEELLKKGGLSAKIATAFLRQHGIA